MSLRGMKSNRYIHFIINVKDVESNDVQLIASHSDSHIRIWDFYAGNLKKKIKIENWVNLGGICLWKKKFLFCACKNGTIKYVDLENGKIIKNIDSQSGQIINIEKVNHPVFGTCLLTQSLGISNIKFWINQSKN
jgi:WD40 repeat protein